VDREGRLSDPHDHSNQVNLWMGQAAKGLSSEQSLQLFELAMAALWSRALLTLGDVTLTAILDRVLYNASERFAPFELLGIEANGLNFRELRAQSNVLNQRELEDAIRFVIVEFLVVIGNLTAEILTPILHSELLKVTLKDSAAGGNPKEGKS
jgi:hypothetical protein